MNVDAKNPDRGDMSRVVRALAFVVVLFATSLAWAGDTPDNADAKAYFSDGIAAFERGEYAAASRAFAAGYEVEKWSGFLFAWAQSERKAKNCEKAVSLYSRFIATKPPDEAKEHALGWIKECGGEYVEPPPEDVRDKELEEKERREKELKAKELKEREDRERREKALKATPPPPGFQHKLAIGLGVAAIASSSVAIWQYRRARRDFDSADEAIDYDDVELRRERGDGRLLVARIAGGIGLGFAAAAVLRFVLHDTTPKTEIVPSGNGIALRRRF